MRIDLERLARKVKRARLPKPVQVAFHPRSGSLAKKALSPRPKARTFEEDGRNWLEISWNFHEPKKMRFELDAGTDDDVEVVVKGDVVYVYTENTRLDYCGLEMFAWKNHGTDEYYEVGDIFLQGGERIEESLGKRGLDLTTATKVRYLSEYIY